MGTWSTTAPTNLATSWTTEQNKSATGGYRMKISGNYVYIYYNCQVLVSSVWLKTGQLCVRIKNYSCAIQGASSENSLSTNAYITDENGTKVYADTNTSIMGDSTETTYGHLRGTYYYTYDASFAVTTGIEAGIRDNNGVYGNGTCSVTVVTGTKPSSGGSTATASQNLYLKVNGSWLPILWG